MEGKTHNMERAKERAMVYLLDEDQKGPLNRFHIEKAIDIAIRVKQEEIDALKDRLKGVPLKGYRTFLCTHCNREYVEKTKERYIPCPHCEGFLAVWTEG